MCGKAHEIVLPMSSCDLIDLIEKLDAIGRKQQLQKIIYVIFNVE